jgi:hypothetical protein
MTTTATHTPTRYVALELGQDNWLLACATQAAEKPRFRSLPARDLIPLRGAVRCCRCGLTLCEGYEGPCSEG